jgi:hypothetical protein
MYISMSDDKGSISSCHILLPEKLFVLMGKEYYERLAHEVTCFSDLHMAGSDTMIQ